MFPGLHPSEEGERIPLDLLNADGAHRGIVRPGATLSPATAKYTPSDRSPPSPPPAARQGHRQRHDPPPVSFAPQQFAACLAAPDTQRPVGPRRRHPRRPADERHARHRVGVPHELPQFAAAGQVPDVDVVVGARHQHEGAVGRHVERRDQRPRVRARPRPQPQRLAAVADVPDADRAVPAARQARRRVRRQGHRPHDARVQGERPPFGHRRQVPHAHFPVAAAADERLAVAADRQATARCGRGPARFAPCPCRSTGRRTASGRERRETSVSPSGVNARAVTAPKCSASSANLAAVARPQKADEPVAEGDGQPRTERQESEGVDVGLELQHVQRRGPLDPRRALVDENSPRGRSNRGCRPDRSGFLPAPAGPAR